MLRVPLSNPNLKRTLRPLYANHQATPWGGFLDPDYDPATDGEIYPGTCLKRVYGEVFTIHDGSGPIHGLSALFVAPSLGVNEMTASGTNLFTVWTGGPDAVFEILAPAFDVDAAWEAPGPDNPGVVYLHSNADGLLTLGGAAKDGVELIDVISENKIVVRVLLPGS